MAEPVDDGARKSVYASLWLDTVCQWNAAGADQRQLAGRQERKRQRQKRTEWKARMKNRKKVEWQRQEGKKGRKK